MAGAAPLNDEAEPLPAALLQEGRAPVRERLMTTLILVGLLHALVILGVTFAPLVGGSSGAPGLEVLLVSDELPEARANDDAVYLAQRTQLGSGNTREREAARTGGPRQVAQSGKTSSAAAEAAPLEESLLASRSPQADATYVAPQTTQQGDQGRTEQRASVAADDDIRLRGERREELWVSPDTRAARLAPYLDAWKRRVERVGTLNYPSAAQRLGLKGNPVLEVAIAANGALQSVAVRRSSGHPEIDTAALQILRLAGPFEPLPDDVAKEYRVLRFAYEWQFVGGGLRPGKVSVP